MNTAPARLLDTGAVVADGCLPQPLRSAALARLAETGFPQLKTEAWKYTSLRALESRLAQSRAVDEDFVRSQLHAYFGKTLPAACLVFAGGRLQHRLSRLDGVTLDTAAEQAAEHLHDGLGGVEDAFVRLCLAQAGEAWSLTCGGGDAASGNPEGEDGAPLALHIVHLSPAAGSDEAMLSTDQLLLHLAVKNGQRIDCVEHVLLQNGQFYNQCLVLDVAAHTQCRHVRLIQCGERAIHFARSQVNLYGQAVYRHADAVTGGQLIRHEARIHHLGPGAFAALASAAKLAGRTRLDQDWLMVHGSDDCHSEQYFRAAVAASSAASFTGRARIVQGVRGSVVHQSSRGLMLSDDAEVNARPVLEIYADEVQATHGATVGCLDEDALHYLRTRGVPEDVARQMLIEAFVNSAFDGIEAGAMHRLLMSFFGGDGTAEST